MYSAKKVGGKKLYELARAGKEIERKPVAITIYDLQLLKSIIHNSLFMIRVLCHVSSGTYIRSLAHDLGQTLGCGAYLEELERTAVGPFKLIEAQTITEPLKYYSWEKIKARLTK